MPTARRDTCIVSRLLTENRDRDEMQRLLAYANFSKVAEAVGVKRAAVANWAAGRHVTPARLEQVRALYGLPVASQGTTKEPPEPAWLEGLVREVRMNRAVIQAMFAAGDPALVQRILDRFAAPGQLPTSSGDEAPDPIDAAT